MKTRVVWNMSEVRRAMGRVKKASEKEAKSLVNLMAIKTATSAAKATKQSQKKRELVEFRGDQIRNVGYRYGVQTFAKPTAFAANRRSGGVLSGNWWFTNVKAVAEDMRIIALRGLARATWESILQKMNVRRTQVPQVLRGIASRLTWVNFQRSSPYTIRFVNRSKYMTDPSAGGPGILTESMQKAARSMVHEAREKVARAQRKAWGGVTA